MTSVLGTGFTSPLVCYVGVYLVEDTHWHKASPCTSTLTITGWRVLRPKLNLRSSVTVIFKSPHSLHHSTTHWIRASVHLVHVHLVPTCSRTSSTSRRQETSSALITPAMPRTPNTNRNPLSNDQTCSSEVWDHHKPAEQFQLFLAQILQIKRFVTVQ